MPIFKFTTTNPSRVLTISATDRAEADTKFNQMRDASGLTEESAIISVSETEPMQNIVEHAELPTVQETEVANSVDADAATTNKTTE